MTSCLKVNETVMAYADDCSTLPVATDLGSNWECDKEPLTETQCRTIDQGGICSTPPQNASLTRKDAGDAIASGGQTKTEAPPIIPNFNVDIPGFVAPEDGGLLFGAYVSAIYRYAISISAVIATVMFIWGGFVYLVGSSMGSVQTGRSIMIDAIIGLVILFSANMILRTLNPNLVFFDSLDIQTISTDLLDNYSTGAGTVAGIDSLPPGDKQATARAVIEGAKLAGVDPCIMLAICEHETGLRSIWSGYPRAPKETATAYGPCQVAASNFANGALGKIVQRRFPDFPTVTPNQISLSPTDKLKVADWLLTNVTGSAYIASFLFRANVRAASNNELTALAGYGAGSFSIQKWREANGCTVKSGLKISTATKNDLAASCIPHMVGIASRKDPKKGCPEDKYNCLDAKINERSEFVGHCSDGRQCYGMLTDAFVLYIMDAYPRIKATYQCDK